MNRKVLLVEDDGDTLKCYSDLLVAEGYEVRTARTGEEALGALNGYVPDLILLDIMLPEMSGIDVIRSLSARTNGNAIPVVIVTALDSVPNQEAIEKLPFVKRFIYKPCRPRTLLEGISHALRQL